MRSSSCIWIFQKYKKVKISQCSLLGGWGRGWWGTAPACLQQSLDIQRYPHSPGSHQEDPVSNSHPGSSHINSSHTAVVLLSHCYPCCKTFTRNNLGWIFCSTLSLIIIASLRWRRGRWGPALSLYHSQRWGGDILTISEKRSRLQNAHIYLQQPGELLIFCPISQLLSAAAALLCCYICIIFILSTWPNSHSLTLCFFKRAAMIKSLAFCSQLIILVIASSSAAFPMSIISVEVPDFYWGSNHEWK